MVRRPSFGPRYGIHFINDTREWRHCGEDGRITSLETLIEPTSTDLIDLACQNSDKRNRTNIDDLLTPADSETYTHAPNGFLRTARGPWSGTAGRRSTAAPRAPTEWPASL